MSAAAQHRITHMEAVAHHEAGHAVAATMRGDGAFTGLDLEATRERDAITYTRTKPCDVPFVAYAGPWAEARATWGDRPLDGQDDDGATFPDYIAAAFLMGGHDDLEDMKRHDLLPADPPDGWTGGLDAWRKVPQTRERLWGEELEYAWPTIRAVAAHIMRHRALAPADLERIASVQGTVPEDDDQDTAADAAPAA